MNKSFDLITMSFRPLSLQVLSDCHSLWRFYVFQNAACYINAGKVGGNDGHCVDSRRRLFSAKY